MGSNRKKEIGFSELEGDIRFEPAKVYIKRKCTPVWATRQKYQGQRLLINSAHARRVLQPRKGAK